MDGNCHRSGGSNRTFRKKEEEMMRTLESSEENMTGLNYI